MKNFYEFFSESFDLDQFLLDDDDVPTDDEPEEEPDDDFHQFKLQAGTPVDVFQVNSRNETPSFEPDNPFVDVDADLLRKNHIIKNSLTFPDVSDAIPQKERGKDIHQVHFMYFEPEGSNFIIRAMPDNVNYFHSKDGKPIKGGMPCADCKKSGKSHTGQKCDTCLGKGYTEIHDRHRAKGFSHVLTSDIFKPKKKAAPKKKTAKPKKK